MVPIEPCYCTTKRYNYPSNIYATCTYSWGIWLEQRRRLGPDLSKVLRHHHLSNHRPVLRFLRLDLDLLLLLKFIFICPPGGKCRIHGTGSGVPVRGVGSQPLRQALWPVVAGGHRVYPPLRIPAVQGRLRLRLRLGEGRELSRLSGPPVYFDTGKLHGPILD